uniref:Pyrroline-5-carboxylate reductase n=3 Tax=Rhodnius TaxID=13248 RepID=T1HNJ3_RHOPR
MPNTPCQVGSGCSVMCYDPAVPKEYVDQVKKIMSFTGTCDVIPEHMFDSAAAVCGSGPAYVYMVIESLADGAVRCGVPRNVALKLASQTIIGAGKMVLESGKHPGQLKDEVCSPAGTTIAAVHELEKSGMRCAFMNAVVAATNRSIELSKFLPKK